MSLALFALVVVNTLLPLLGLWWLIAPSRIGRAEWLAKALLVAAYLFCVTFASIWLVPSVYAPHAYAGLLALAIGIGWLVVRRRGWAPATRAQRVRIGAYVLLALVFAGIGAYGVLGRAGPSGAAVDLAFPLPPGTYYVSSGGSNRLVNPHLGALPRGRGESHAVDIVAVDRYGQRASGVLPGDPAAYVVFGRPVLAPCDGTVRRAVDGLPDQRPPAVDRTHVAGNHVLLGCGEADVLLAHLRSGSVAVKAGDTVRRGDRVGEVGNSGNSGEPHLHVHAQRTRAGGGDPLLDAEPLPITLQGRTPHRGLLQRP